MRISGGYQLLQIEDLVQLIFRRALEDVHKLSECSVNSSQKSNITGFPSRLQIITKSINRKYIH